MQTEAHNHTRLSSFCFVTLIGTGVYLAATIGFHAYTASTILLPIAIANLLMKVSGQRIASGGEAMLGVFAITVAAVLAGLVFGLVYWPVENRFVRPRYPRAVRASRIIAGFLFFLFVWLAFPISQAL